MCSVISNLFYPQEVMSFLTNIVSDPEYNKVYLLLSTYNANPTYELRNKCELAVQTLINNVINTKCSYQFVSNLSSVVTLVMLAPGGAPTIVTVLDPLVGNAVTTIYLPNANTAELYPNDFVSYIASKSTIIGNNNLLSIVSPNLPAIYTDYTNGSPYSFETANNGLNTIFGYFQSNLV